MNYKQITVTGLNGQLLTLEARWIGDIFAVTRVTGLTKWRITHLPTGLMMPCWTACRKTLRIAKALEAQPQWKTAKPSKTKEQTARYDELFKEALRNAGAP